MLQYILKESREWPVSGTTCPCVCVIGHQVRFPKENARFSNIYCRNHVSGLFSAQINPNKLPEEGRAAVGDGRVERGIGKQRRHWPGGGRGGIQLEGIASPGVGRTRLEESQRMGRQARITRATPRAVVVAMSCLVGFRIGLSDLIHNSNV